FDRRCNATLRQIQNNKPIAVMETPLFSPFFASALEFAFNKATPEGKVTIGLLVIVSLFSWTVIITKARQLLRARKMSKKFYAAYRGTRAPMEIFNKDDDYAGAPAYEVYHAGGEELAYHLKNNPVRVETLKRLSTRDGDELGNGETDHLAR